jgi:hypothetical protein
MMNFIGEQCQALFAYFHDDGVTVGSNKECGAAGTLFEGDCSRSEKSFTCVNR